MGPLNRFRVEEGYKSRLKEQDLRIYDSTAIASSQTRNRQANLMKLLEIGNRFSSRNIDRYQGFDLSKDQIFSHVAK